MGNWGFGMTPVASRILSYTIIKLEKLNMKSHKTKLLELFSLKLCVGVLAESCKEINLGPFAFISTN